MLPACPSGTTRILRQLIHHFEIPEAHSTLLIEASTRVSTHSRALALDATPASMERLSECARMERCFDYLLPTRYVDLDPATWRLALDVTAGQTDIWQSAVALMRHVHGNFKYTPQSTTVHTRMSEVLSLRQGSARFRPRADWTLPLDQDSRAVCQRLSGDRAGERHACLIEVFVPGVGWQPRTPPMTAPQMIRT